VFQRCDLGLTRTIQLDINPFEHRVQIARNIRIPEANDAISFLLEPKLSFAVAPRDFFATARRIDAETIIISLADRSPHPARASDPPPPGEGEVKRNLKERASRA
jgi:hypothetical protein